MSEHHPYIDDHPVIRLRIWALGQMVWGAFIGGVALAVIAGTMLVIWGVGLLLDERSRETPSPYGAVEIVQTHEVV